MAEKSLVDQFNDSVANWEAQESAEWQDKAMSSLCRKFSLLAKSTDNDTELRDLVAAMSGFMTDYIAKPFNNPDDYESIDAVTEDIEKLGNALVGGTKLGMVPFGTAKELNRLAADIVGMGEDATDGDCDDAFQAQAQKIGEIADALQRFEAAPPRPNQTPAATQDNGPPKPGLSLKL